MENLILETNVAWVSGQVSGHYVCPASPVMLLANDGLSEEFIITFFGQSYQIYPTEGYTTKNLIRIAPL